MKNKKYTNAVRACWDRVWKNYFNHATVTNLFCLSIWKEECFCEVVDKVFQQNFGKYWHFAAKKSRFWFYFIIFLIAQLLMLLVRDGSNLIINLVFRHFSSSFIFSSTSFIVFFCAFFVAIFSWKTQHQVLSFFTSQGNVFQHRSIHHFGLT